MRNWITTSPHTSQILTKTLLRIEKIFIYRFVGFLRNSHSMTLSLVFICVVLRVFPVVGFFWWILHSLYLPYLCQKILPRIYCSLKYKKIIRLMSFLNTLFFVNSLQIFFHSNLQSLIIFTLFMKKIPLFSQLHDLRGKSLSTSAFVRSLRDVFLWKIKWNQHKKNHWKVDVFVI